jgi:hypothetical protein
MSSTCEGTLAWTPRGTDGQYWTFPGRGNYAIRRKDLLDCNPGLCDTCAQSAKVVHLLVNHNTASKRELQCPESSPIPANARTYYGAQVVPLFNKVTSDTQSLSTWLYRNSRLLRRMPDGSFGLTTEPKAMLTTIKPSTYSEITLQETRRPGYSPPHCSGMSKSDCEDLVNVDYFESQLRNGQQWHGWPRRSPASMSTLGDRPTRELWAVPDNWISGALQVKNWILTYKATLQSNSSKPVDFLFCVDDSWDGFLVRTFSPERNIGDKKMHVFLSK